MFHVNRHMFCVFSQRKQWIGKSTNIVYRCLAQANQNVPGQFAQKKDIDIIRNIGIMAHIDAGKTTTTERMLYFSGFSRHMGDVDSGDTVTDYMELERERGITIQSAAVTFRWNKHFINLIDTPGHVDFTVEVERCLRVLDGAVAVLDASAGVEAQTKTVWRQANKYNIPRIIFINKMDKLNANFSMCLRSIKEKLFVEPIPINLPIGKEKTFTGIVDLITMEQQIWNASKCADGSTYNIEKLDQVESNSSIKAVLEARESMIGHLSDIDDTIAEYVLNDTKLEDIPEKDIINALRKLTLSQKGVLVVCGSSKRNIGVQPLLNAVVQYLPSPLDIQYDFLQYYGDSLCALAFKIIHDTQKGALTFLRIYSGTLKSSSIYNSSLGLNEKIGAVYQVNADEYKQLSEIGPGNIVCLTGLKETRSGDTITSSSAAAKRAENSYKLEIAKSGTGEDTVSVTRRVEQNTTSVDDEDDGDDIDRETVGSVLAGLEIPQAVFFCSIYPPSEFQQKKMEDALMRLQREDPSLKVEYDEDCMQTVIRGMGELHIDVIKTRLQTEYGIETYLGPLQIAYKEILDDNKVTEHTIHLENVIKTKKNDVTMTVQLKLNADESATKRSYFSPVVENPLKWKTKNAMRSGILQALSNGPLYQCPVVDIDVCITALTMAPGTSITFLTAATNHCVREALSKSSLVLLEPVMAMEIYTNTQYLHDVQMDIIKRRGQVLDISSNHDDRTIRCITPLAELVGYSTDIRKITSGTAAFTHELSHYQKMTPDAQQKVTHTLQY